MITDYLFHSQWTLCHDLLNVYTESHALIIGIGDYADPNFLPLPGAISDAQKIAEVLSSEIYQFKVKLLLNEQATKAAILEALDSLQVVDPDSRSIVFLRGHGGNIKNKFRETGFIFAYDSCKDKRGTWLPLEEVTTLREYTSGKHMLFIFDSCFSGKALGLKQLKAVSDRYVEKAAYQVLTAGGVEVVVDSPSMTHFLLPLIEQPQGRDLLRLTALFPELQNSMDSAHCVQTPQMGHLEGSEGGDFVFYLSSAPSVWDGLPEELGFLGDPRPGVRLLALQQVPAYLLNPDYEAVVRKGLDKMLVDEPDRRVREQLVVLLNENRERLAQREAERLAQERDKIKDVEPPEMVPIPAGPFLMGSPKSDKLRLVDEPEQFELNLDYDYKISKYPVTVGQYWAFIKADGYINSAYWTQAGWVWRELRTQPNYWTDDKWTGDDNLPVVGVSWHEAYAYTRWLAEATGHNYRLPSEVEWEKAARGGLQLPGGKGGWKKNPNAARLWPWGDEQPDEKLLNFNRNVTHSTPIGRYSRGVSPYNVFDMAGNVWEWCRSKWTSPYNSEEDDEPEANAPRVIRGGSWSSEDSYVRCAVRSKNYPHKSSDQIGFRIVL